VAPEVREMLSEAEVAATFPVMRQLRTHLDEAAYAERVRRMRGGGYRLAAVIEAGEVRCVAGFRVQEFLYAGRHLYVDDLISAQDARSAGHGARMLRWLEDVARREGCGQLHLDSGVQRKDAHRFYFREGLGISSFHFSKQLPDTTEAEGG
jgi:GNAT superfamily N-acetyltransferase